MDTNVVRVECIVRGRVQLVMFRDFTVRKARGLGVVGRVKNINDGSVSVIAEGEQDNIVHFLELLHKGPLLAKIESVDIHYRKPIGEFNDFKIDYDN